MSLTQLFRSLRRWAQPPRRRPSTVSRANPRPMLDFQFRELRERCTPGQEVIIFLPTAPWRSRDDSLTQRYARALAAAGSLVLYDCSGTLADGIGLREVERNLFVYSGPTRYLATLPDPLLWVTIDNVLQCRQYPPNCRVVYHWTEQPDVLRRIHEEALAAATVVIASVPGMTEGNDIIAGGSEADQAARLMARLHNLDTATLIVERRAA